MRECGEVKKFGLSEDRGKEERKIILISLVSLFFFYLFKIHAM